MDTKRNRHRNIEKPFNIWTGDKPRTLRNDETLCEDCGGLGGYSESGTANVLIRCCVKCHGKGSLDWVDRAKGESQDHKEYTFYITHTSDTISAAVKKGQEEEYLEKIRLQVTGEFKFKLKEKI